MARGVAPCQMGTQSSRGSGCRRVGHLVSLTMAVWSQVCRFGWGDPSYPT